MVKSTCSIIYNMFFNSNYYFLIIGATLLFFSPQTQAVDKAQVKEAARQMIDECAKKEGATPEDVERLHKKSSPATKEGVCLLQCIFESAQMMKDGKFDKKGMIEGLKLHFGAVDETTISNIKDFVEHCAKEVGNGSDDRCENARLTVECFEKHSKKFDIDFIED